MANSADAIAHYEPSHQDMHCFQKYLSWSTGLNGLIDDKRSAFSVSNNNFTVRIYGTFTVHIEMFIKGDIEIVALHNTLF